MEGKKELLFPRSPLELTEAMVVVLVDKSRTKMSPLLLVSPGTSSEAADANATNRPSAEMEGRLEKALARSPVELTETRLIVISPHTKIATLVN
jgi:hypothetical protein